MKIYVYPESIQHTQITISLPLIIAEWGTREVNELYGVLLGLNYLQAEQTLLNINGTPLHEYNVSRFSRG